jgi:uncharacterized membrane protein (DUF373 family)
MSGEPHPANETAPKSSRHCGASDLIPHTQLHSIVRRTLENLQDVVVLLLIIVLLILSLQALVWLGRMAFVNGVLPRELLSEIMYILILTELYRLLIFYLREHRISVTLALEVALVSTLREVILKGAHEFDWPQLLGLSLPPIVLGGLLAMERWMTHWRKDVSETSAN